MSMMPADLKHKEKTIGGIITIEELFWLIMGGTVGIAIGFVFGMIITKVVGLVVGFLGLFLGVPFAFWHPYKMNLPDYLISRAKFKKKKKYLTKY